MENVNSLSTLPPRRPRSIANAVDADHHHKIHAKYHSPEAPVVQPHLPDGDSYVLGRSDTQKVFTFVANGESTESGMFVAPQFGPTAQMSAVGFDPDELANIQVSNAISFADNPAATTGTGPWDLFTSNTQQACPAVGGTSPNELFGAASSNHYVFGDRAGVAKGQLLGGYFEITVTTPYDGMCTVYLLDDSNQLCGRHAVPSQVSERAPNFAGPSGNFAIRSVGAFTTLAALCSAHQVITVPGNKSMTFRMAITPRVMCTICLDSDILDTTATHRPIETCGPAVLGCAPVNNPLFGFAQTGCGVVICNSNQSSVTMKCRAHIVAAYLPAINGTTVTPSQVALMQPHFRVGRFNPYVLEHVRSIAPAGVTVVDGPQPLAGPRFVEGYSTSGMNVPEEKGTLSKVVSTVESAAKGAAEVAKLTQSVVQAGRSISQAFESMEVVS